MNRTDPNASGEVIAFNPNIDEVFSNSKRKFIFCGTKRVAGIVVLQKLGKTLVPSGDVTMNLFL